MSSKLLVVTSSTSSIFLAAILQFIGNVSCIHMYSYVLDVIYTLHFQVQE